MENQGHVNSTPDQTHKDIAKLVDVWRANTDVELEVRLGLLKKDDHGNRRFEAKVSKEDFETMLKDISACTQWSQTQPWTVTIDLIYDDSERATIHDGNRVTTSIRTQKMGQVNCDTFGLPYQLRFALKRETPINSTASANGRRVVCVRIKMRCRFVYQNRWAYDFTTVKTAPDQETAMKNVNTLQQDYEIEIEMLPAGLQHYARHSSEDISRSIATKATDLLLRLPCAPSYGLISL